MAQPALEFFDRLTLLVKAQPTAGTDPVPVGATDGFRLFNGKQSWPDEKVELPVAKSFLGADDRISVNQRGVIEGDFEMYPPATPGAMATSDAYCDRVLLPGGFAVTKDDDAKTSIYTPVSSGFPLIAFRTNRSGVYTNCLNGRAAISALTAAIGQRVTGHAQLQGDYTSIAGQAFPTVTLPDIDRLVATERNTVCTISTEVDGAVVDSEGTPLDDLHVWGKSLIIDTGMGVQKEAYTEHSENNFDGRKGSWKLQLAKTAVDDDFNPLFVRDQNIVVVVNFWVYRDDTKDGLYTRLFARGKIDDVSEDSIQGKSGWTLSGRCLGTEANAGGDQFGVEFGDAAP